MSTTWETILKELGLDETPTDAPPGESGEWTQLLAEFRTHGFVRVLASFEANRLAAHFAHEGVSDADVDALVSRLSSESADTWTAEKSDGTTWLLGGVEDGGRMTTAATLRRLAESLREDVDLSWAAGADGGVPTVDDDENEPADEADDAPDEVSTAALPEPADHAEDAAQTSAPAGFEAIGAGDSTQPEDGEFAFGITRHDGDLHVALRMETRLDDVTRDALNATLRRNIRAKFDADVRPFTVEELRETAFPFSSSAGLVVTPVALGTSAPSLDALEGDVGAYFETISELATSGISPMVFLGCAPSAKLELDPGRPSHDLQVADEDAPDADELILVIDDEVDSEDEVVLGGIAADGPLQTGNFEDPRLKEPDAHSQLVDVVLRHPGYSDRRVGQVLSILFSIEYHQALKLMRAAPCIIARGVSDERGNTIQTVVEGAGGRVQLTEPDRYPAAE